MQVFRRNEDREWPAPGEWRAVRDRERRRGAAICCPGCRQVYSVGLTAGHHRIAQDGAVSPSVGCLTDGCGFHEFIRLESWIPQ